MKYPENGFGTGMQSRLPESTAWLSESEIQKSAFALPPEPTPYHLQFGMLDGTGTQLTYSRDGSVITIAPPGAGKTQCNILPNLLHWPGPAVVLDVGDELYDKTARWRSENVGPVIRFCPTDPAHSACYSPLSFIRREPFDVWEDARKLADMMIVSEPKPTEGTLFFEEGARYVLTAVITDLVLCSRSDERSIAKVLNIIHRDGWNEFVDRLCKNQEVRELKDAGASLATMGPETLDIILQVANRSMRSWQRENIAQVTKRSDWSPLDLRNGRNLTIYICVPPDVVDTFASLLRVLIAQHIRVLMMDQLRRYDAPRILFFLDEVAQLSHMNYVEIAVGAERRTGIQLWIFAQSLRQLRRAYPNVDVILANCAVRTFMNPNLTDGTAQQVAEQIRTRCIPVDANGQSILTPAELAGPNFEELQVVLGIASKPAKVRKAFAYKNRELQARMATA